MEETTDFACRGNNMVGDAKTWALSARSTAPVKPVLGDSILRLFELRYRSCRDEEMQCDEKAPHGEEVLTCWARDFIPDGQPA